MSMWKAGLLGLMIPMALAAPLMAQDRGGPDGPRMVFEEIDLNGDGAVTLEELQAMPQARFANADTDGDGLLTRDELIAAGQDRVARGVDRMIERADANGDGAVSLEEMAELQEGRRGPNPSRMFGRMDANGDGQITEEEFQAAAERWMERRGPGGRHGHDRDRG